MKKLGVIDEPLKEFHYNVTQPLIEYTEGKYYGSNRYSDKKHVVLWSGGVDSAVLLHDLIRTFGVKNVIAVSIVDNHLKEQVQAEKYARNLFIKFCVDNGIIPADSDFIRLEVDINVYANEVAINCYKQEERVDYPKLQSSPLISVVNLIGNYFPDQTIFYDATLGHDWSSSKIDQITCAFQDICTYLGKDFTLRMPYLKWEKMATVTRAIKLNIIPYTWSCDYNFDGNPCCTCDSCRYHIQTLMFIKEFNSNPHTVDLASKTLEAYTYNYKRIRKEVEERRAQEQEEKEVSHLVAHMDADRKLNLTSDSIINNHGSTADSK